MLFHNGWFMRCSLILSVALLLLAGCVTETSSVIRNNPNAQSPVNNQEAAKTRIALALQYLNAGNTTQAKFNLERAASFAPELPEVHYALAYYYEQVDEKEWAKKAYQKALALNPNDPNALNNYGTFLCRIGEYDASAEQLLKAINTPTYFRVAQSYENLSLCAVKQDKFALALDYAENAVQHNGRSQSALIGLAALFYAKSELHRAENVLKVYQERGFMSARALLLEHLLHQNMGHLQRAQELSTMLIQTYPSSREASLLLREDVLNSEFEKLKEQYRQAQIKKIKDTPITHFVSDPKIKITRKKVATSASANQVTEALKVPNTTQSVSLRSEGVEFTSGSPDLSTVSSSEKLTNIAVDESDNESDGVRVVSFGDAVSDLSPPSSGVVKFYETDPSKVVFSNQNPLVKQGNDAVIIKQSSLEDTVNFPLLNSEVSVPHVPYHIVNVAENLFSLSVRYDIRMVNLLEWIGLKASDKVTVGTKIYLNNPKVTHAIQASETLYNIATQHGLQIDDLMRWNKLTPDVTLMEGHSLLIVDPNSYVL